MKKNLKKKVKRKSRPIVAGFLELVNARIFDSYRNEITDMIRGYQGIYALYRKGKLYYVGLASNLKNRLRTHLRDRHKGKWTHFSLYIIRKSAHIKELESVLLRIAYPEGNTQRGKLRRSVNLLPVLKRRVKERIRVELGDLFETGKRKSSKARRKTNKKSRKTKAKKPLKGYFPAGKRLYATYKRKDYKAWVFGGGSIKFNGKLYNSPSKAAKAIIDRGAVNGWHFWKYKDASGNLIAIKNLRK